MIIGTINVQTLQKDGKIPELIASTKFVKSTKHDIIWIQEHRFLHETSQQKNINMEEGNWSHAQPGKQH